MLAANPGPMTLDGTNTWVLAEPGAARVVVVDPGPADETHLRAVREAAEAEGRQVGLIVVTHGHPDHTEGLPRFAELTGAPVRAATAELLPMGLPGAVLADGEPVELDGLRLEALHTPGHTGDSLSLQLPADQAVLTGDTVLGRGTSVVAHPDGRLGDYLDSLRRLRKLAAAGSMRVVLPGHGPMLTDALGAIDFLLAHRANRLAQVESAVEAGHRSAADVVAQVYADVDHSVWPAAELTVRAQLDYLTERGLI